MAKKVARPAIKVQSVYSGAADMREVFVFLLVGAVRRRKYPVHTFENVKGKGTYYNEGKNQAKEVIRMGVLRTALYCRLPKDNMTQEDSESIKTQKIMFSCYVQEQGRNLYAAYCDDDDG